MTEACYSVVVTGCRRGIGLALAYRYAKNGYRVFATARCLEGSDDLKALANHYNLVSLHALDVSCDESINSFVRELDGQALDLVINSAGLYGVGGSDLGYLSRQAWRQVLEVNTISPVMLTQALVANLMAGSLKVVAMLSSKVGSIADNSSGGGYYYRSSKTALNQVVKSLSIDLAAQGIKVVALHPGWVQTEMGGPNALISTERSALGLYQVLAGVNEDKSGCFYSYEGAEIPW